MGGYDQINPGVGDAESSYSSSSSSVYAKTSIQPQLQPAQGERLRGVLALLNSAHGSDHFQALSKLRTAIDKLEAKPETKIEYFRAGINDDAASSGSVTAFETTLAQLSSSAIDPNLFGAMTERKGFCWWREEEQPLEPPVVNSASSDPQQQQQIQLQRTDYQESKAIRASIQARSLLFDYLTSSPECIEVFRLWDSHVRPL